MKLLVCRLCDDVVKLQRDIRDCRCRASRGRYLPDGIKVQVWGDHVEVMGLLNESLRAGVDALALPKDRGPDLSAFLFPRVHERVQRMGVWR